MPPTDMAAVQKEGCDIGDVDLFTLTSRKDKLTIKSKWFQQLQVSAATTMYGPDNTVTIVFAPQGLGSDCPASAVASASAAAADCAAEVWQCHGCRAIAPNASMTALVAVPWRAHKQEGAKDCDVFPFHASAAAPNGVVDCAMSASGAANARR